MGKFIIAAVILFTLSAIPFCDGKTLPLKERERIVHAKIKEVCDEPTYQGFIKCESKPGIESNVFNPEDIQNEVGAHGGIIYAIAEPSPKGATADVRIIWRFTREGGETVKVRIFDAVRVAMKFQFQEEISSKQKKYMFMLYRFGITPLLHEFQLGKSKILTDFILMERIEGVTLFQYYEYSKHIGMREVESEALKKARWRIRGLRELYYNKDLMLFLKTLIDSKFRHCSLHWRNIMIRRSTEEEIQKLEEQLREDEPATSPAEEDWIALQIEARSIVVQDGSYHTTNKHMVFIDLDTATPVDLKRQSDRGNPYQVCGHGSDFYRSIVDWMASTDPPPHDRYLNYIKRAIRNIYILIRKEMTAAKEKQVLEKVIERLKKLEEEEKMEFISQWASLEEESHNKQRVPDLSHEQQVRPQLSVTFSPHQERQWQSIQQYKTNERRPRIRSTRYSPHKRGVLGERSLHHSSDKQEFEPRSTRHSPHKRQKRDKGMSHYSSDEQESIQRHMFQSWMNERRSIYPESKKEDEESVLKLKPFLLLSSKREEFLPVKD